MSHRFRLGSMLLALIAACPRSWSEGSVMAFPGAQGFGAQTPAGRGGKTVRVTTLAPSGPGSLREAVEMQGPRIVIFEVGGVIDLAREEIQIKEPFLTVAGQTSPSPGITLIRGTLAVMAHDVLIQHIRVRTGDAGQPKRSGWEPDGLSIGGANAYDVVVDHCSVSWAVDENMPISGPRYEGPDATAHRVTISHCIIAEGLDDSCHGKGPHSKGSLIHDYCRDIAIIGNLYAHNRDRNPYFKAFTTGVIVNNLIYDPGFAAIQLGLVPGEWNNTGIKPETCRVSIVGNVMLHGQDSFESLPLVKNWGDAYMEDNKAFNKGGEPVALTLGQIKVLDEKPSWPEGIAPIPSDQVEAEVLRCAGARPKDRDAVDARIVQEVRDRGGRIINSQDEVGGYPNPEMTQRPLIVPEDVDAWLHQMAAELE